MLRAILLLTMPPDNGGKRRLGDNGRYFDAPDYIDESFLTRENILSKSLPEECASHG